MIVSFCHRGHREHREMENDELTEAIIGAAIEVHKVLGPGLLESIYAKSSNKVRGKKHFAMNLSLEV